MAHMHACTMQSCIYASIMNPCLCADVHVMHICAAVADAPTTNTPDMDQLQQSLAQVMDGPEGKRIEAVVCHVAASGDLELAACMYKTLNPDDNKEHNKLKEFISDWHGRFIHTGSVHDQYRGGGDRQQLNYEPLLEIIEDIRAKPGEFSSWKTALQTEANQHRMQQSGSESERYVIRLLKRLAPDLQQYTIHYKDVFTPEDMEARLEECWARLHMPTCSLHALLKRVFFIDWCAVYTKPKSAKILITKVQAQDMRRTQQHSVKRSGKKWRNRMKILVCVNWVVGPVAIAFGSSTDELPTTKEYTVCAHSFTPACLACCNALCT